MIRQNLSIIKNKLKIKLGNVLLRRKQERNHLKKSRMITKYTFRKRNGKKNFRTRSDTLKTSAWKEVWQVDGSFQGASPSGPKSHVTPSGLHHFCSCRLLSKPASCHSHVLKPVRCPNSATSCQGPSNKSDEQDCGNRGWLVLPRFISGLNACVIVVSFWGQCKSRSVFILGFVCCNNSIT